MQQCLELIGEIRTLEPGDLEDMFYGVMPDATKLNRALDKIEKNIEKVKKVPICRRTYDVF